MSLQNRADRDFKPTRSASVVAAWDRDTIGDHDESSQSHPPDIPWRREQKLEVTRSRAYKKNDQLQL